MSLSQRATRALAAAALAALSFTVPSAARAESVGVADAEGDAGGSLSDIRKVKANFGEAQLFVKVRFAELEPETEFGGSSLSLFVDTDATRRGPEFRLASGLQHGTDYQLVRMVDWRPVGENLSCRHALRLDFDANVLAARMGRACLGAPAEVRVGAKMIDMYDGSHPTVDWLKKPRGFTRWLSAG